MKTILRALAVVAVVLFAGLGSYAQSRSGLLAFDRPDYAALADKDEAITAMVFYPYLILEERDLSAATAMEVLRPFFQCCQDGSTVVAQPLNRCRSKVAGVALEDANGNVTMTGTFSADKLTAIEYVYKFESPSNSGKVFKDLKKALKKLSDRESYVNSDSRYTCFFYANNIEHKLTLEKGEMLGRGFVSFTVEFR